jgi:transposase
MKLRKWTSEEKMAIVLEGIKGQKSVAEICREHQISQTHSRHEPESVATLDRNMQLYAFPHEKILLSIHDSREPKIVDSSGS